MYNWQFEERYRNKALESFKNLEGKIIVGHKAGECKTFVNRVITLDNGEELLTEHRLTVHGESIKQQELQQGILAEDYYNHFYLNKKIMMVTVDYDFDGDYIKAYVDFSNYVRIPFDISKYKN